MTERSTSTAGPQRDGQRWVLLPILITLLLDVMSLGIIIPVFPKLVEGFMAGDTAGAASVFGVFGIAWALMQLIFQPVLGSLSDQYGRRPVILLSNFGLGLDYIVMALAPDLAWLFVGRVISGITAASFSTATAYIADVTPPERRAQNFGMIGVAFGLGFILGPAIGGLLGNHDPRLPFWVAAAFSLLNAVYVLFVLPESLAKDQRKPFAAANLNPFRSLTLLRSHPQLMGLAGVNFLYQLAHAVLPSIFVLYAGYRYGWNARDVGLALAAVGVCSAIVQGGLIRPVVGRIGERPALIIGLLCGAVGFAIYGLAETGTMFLAGLPIMALWGLASPSAQALMTRRVGPMDQGLLQGANGSIMAIANLIGPGLFTQTFALFIGPEAGWHLPGAPFLLAALLLALAAALAWRITTGGAGADDKPAATRSAGGQPVV